MISILQIENLTKSYGDRLLFSDLTLGIYEGDKVGIVARNGAGKSTLLNILAGREDYDSGRIVYRSGVRVGYLEQQPQFDPAQSALSYATPPLRPGREASDREVWDAPEAARRMLTMFGIPDVDMPMGNMSGGQVKRAALAKVLLEEPDFLILDEPTNHLDIPMVEWLEQYLQRKRVTILLVTHDRYFLDKVCNKIIEIDRESVYIYEEGGFENYLRRRRERIDAMQTELARVRNLLRTELEWMRRQPQARGSKARYRIDNFHQLEQRSHVDLRESDVALKSGSSYIGSKIFEAKEVSKSYGDIRILDRWSYTFARYEKVGIVGDNGVGKSTFIKMLLGEVSPDSGSFDVGETVRWGYYSQEGMTGFDENKKVIDAVREITESVRIDEKTTVSASQFLSDFLFTPETQQKYIGKLSGGERRRLYLATVLMRRPNFLILDEPTNDLDIITLTVLEDYLVNFKGCIIVVSHDRFFLDRIVDHLFVFKGSGVVQDFPGDYSTYRHCVAQEEKERREAERLEAERKTQSAGTAGTADGGQRASGRDHKPRAVKLSFKEKREMEELEAKLPEMEKEKAALEAAMSSGEMSPLEIVEAGAKMQTLIKSIDAAEMRLLELMEKDS